MAIDIRFLWRRALLTRRNVFASSNCLFRFKTDMMTLLDDNKGRFRGIVVPYCVARLSNSDHFVVTHLTERF